MTIYLKRRNEETFKDFTFRCQDRLAITQKKHPEAYMFKKNGSFRGKKKDNVYIIKYND